MKERFLHARRRLGGFALRNMFELTSHAAKLHPAAHREHAHLSITRDVAYLATGRTEHLANIVRPKDAKGPLPTVLYIHGGAFQILSKDTHWIMSLMFARQGYLVVSINYRLAPKHPYPAALEDCAAAYEWLVKNIASLGGDPTRLVLAGESAGANLVSALTVAACYPRPEPFAKKVFDTGVVPIATLPACGILQATDSARFGRRRELSTFLNDRLIEVERGYLPASPFLKSARSASHAQPSIGYDFADPLVMLERGERPARPLPPFFIACGTRDPILDDSRRLAKALDKLGVTNELAIYPGGVHAFHALVFLELARKQWRDNFAFLNRVSERDVTSAAPMAAASEARNPTSGA